MTTNELDKLRGVISDQTQDAQKEDARETTSGERKARIINERAKLVLSGKGQIKAEAFDIINTKAAQAILKDTQK